MKLRYLLSLAMIVIILMITMCKKDNVEPETTFKLIAGQQVGAAGASIVVADRIVLDIPAGSFSSSVNIEIYSTNEENPFAGSGGASEMLYVKGLPDDFTIPVRIAIKHDSDAPEDTYIGMGFIAQATSTFDTVFGNKLFPAVDSSGYLVSMILPATAPDRNVKEEDHSHKGKFGVPFFCLENMFYYQTDHFIIYFNSKYYNLGTIQSLAGGLEDAHYLLKQWGFQYNSRTAWPMVVEVKPIKGKKDNEIIYGQSLRSFPYTANTGYIEINEHIINKPDSLRITAAHEFFHVIQDLYNYDDKYNWLQEASSVWFEEFFAPDPSSYVSKVFQNNVYQPLKGLQAGRSAGQGDHGYGCAAVIKYLMDINNASNEPSAIHSIWQAATTSEHPVEILLNFQSDLPDWWNDFIFNYYIDDVYPGITREFGKYYFNDRPQFKFKVQSDQDKQKQFDNVGIDLSAQHYMIDLDWSGLTSKSNCEITLAGGLSYLYIFRYKTDDVALIGELATDKKVTILDLKSYYDNGYDFILLLSNPGAHASFGYEKFSPTKISINIGEEEVNTVTYYEVVADNTSAYFSGSFHIIFETEDDYPFTVTKDEYYISGGTKVKDMSIHFDPPPAGQIVTFNITIDTLSLSCVNPGKIHFDKATWMVSDMTQIPYVYPQPDILPYHVTAQYSNSISAGPCSFYLSLVINDPYFYNGLDVMMLGFNIGKEP